MAAIGIGEELRRERIRQGLTLDDIVARTRISSKSLTAIEDDAFDRLPGIVFTRGFVRLYATDLKLDPGPMLARMPRVDIGNQPLPVPPVNAPTKWDPRWIAALTSFAWLVALTGAGTGAWYYYDHYGLHLVRTIASAPAPKHAQTVAAISTPPPPTVEPASSSAPTPEAATAENYDSSRPVQVVLTASEAAWVQISTDGKVAFVGTLHANDRREIAADAQVRIITGNAGGIKISLNGKPLDPIGPSGQIRTVRLTAEGPELVGKTPPASSPL